MAPRRMAGVVAVVAVATVLAWSMRDDVAPATPVPAQAAAMAGQATPTRPSPLRDLQPFRVDARFLQMQVFAGPPRTDESGRRPLAGEVVDDLQARAAAGEVDAMRALGIRLHECLGAFNDPEGAEITRTYDVAREQIGKSPDYAASRNEGAFLTYTSRMAQHNDCLALGRERAALGLGWLERAARAGNVAAKVAYATHAFDTAAYPDDTALLSDLDEVLRRRALVDAWVIDGIESGERTALANITNSPDTTVRDPRMRATYDLAWKMVLAREVPDGQWADQVHRLQGADYRELLGQEWTEEPGAWDAYIAEAGRIASRTSG